MEVSKDDPLLGLAAWARIDVIRDAMGEEERLPILVDGPGRGLADPAEGDLPVERGIDAGFLEAP